MTYNNPIHYSPTPTQVPSSKLYVGGISYQFTFTGVRNSCVRLNEGAKCIKIGKPCPPGTEGCCDKFSCWKRNTRCCCPKPETTANPTTVPTTAEPTLEPTTVLRSGRLMPSSIERFHMTSRRPYWCSKTMKRRHVGVPNQSGGS